MYSFLNYEIFHLFPQISSEFGMYVSFTVFVVVSLGSFSLKLLLHSGEFLGFFWFLLLFCFVFISLYFLIKCIFAYCFFGYPSN